MELFVQVAPGLEPALERELADLWQRGSAEPGGIVLRGSRELVARLNLELATASKVLVTVGSFRATGLGELERKAADLPWAAFAAPGARAAWRVTTRKSRLYHTGAIAERLDRAMAAALGRPPAAEGDEVPFVVRVVRDRVVIRADASGEHLHRRGYRPRPTKAPLRETLAAGVLRLVDWTPDRPLVDPMCGSGTFPIEAALRAGRQAPGQQRSFAFERWPDADAAGLETLRAEALRRVVPVEVPIVGTDRDAGAVEAARDNARGAGLSSPPRFERAAISEARPPDGAEGGLLVCNPPWGRRVGDPGPLRDLHARLGQVARRHFAGWTLALVSPSAELVRQADRRAQRVATIPVGGVTVGVWSVPEL